MHYLTKYHSPVGLITLASDDKKLVGLWLKGQKYFGDTMSGETSEKNELPVFSATKKWLDRYFAGEKPDVLELPLAPEGSAFRQSVWNILCEIPYGEVVTYGYIAKRMAKIAGKKAMSAQAVGGAVGHNPISIIIPCHRVVGSNASLTGYAGGIKTKIKLLELEGVDTACFSVPKKGTAL